MSYSAKGADAWIAEQNHEIERQHGEITELSGRLADVLKTNADLVSEKAELEVVIDALGLNLKDVEEASERQSAAISSAIEDLRLLSEVPLGELEDAIKAVADRLADKNGDRY